MKTTYKIEIKGIVQGVGFRPYVYNLALKLGINGWVNNDDKGVNILISSTENICQKFINELKQNPPKLSKINEIKIKKITLLKDCKSFEILRSETTNNKLTIISPDMAICEDCIEDINDKNNFRYNYALTNCTNCGPRYSIIKTVPYDRHNTSMKNFVLCKKCELEYKDPTNRRYHAQPVSCEECGPTVTLYNKNNKVLSSNIQAIKQIANYINNGEIVAIKGTGGFHLICDATNDNAVKELRKRKTRLYKPFAIMFKDLNSVKSYTNMSLKEEEIVNSKEKPIVILKKKEKTNISPFISPNINYLGSFISYTPLHHLLFRYLNNPIVATSANLKDEPIIRYKDELVEKLSNIVEFILDYNRDIVNGCDDSVIQIVNNDILKLRNARGYAPSALKLKKSTTKNILALGANQKSTIVMAFENNLILSPHIGDLNNIESMDYFQRTIETFKRFYDFEPNIIVCDKHPNYESTKFAKNLKKNNPNLELIQVQHHYAHILSTMAEFNLKKKVLGFSFDGTGYGDDGNIWGGEVFICDNKEYERVHHIKYFKLLGGQLAIKEPKRVALSLLFDNFTLEETLSLDIPTIKAFKKNEIIILHKMWEKGLNSNYTSSIGRLFDAIASFSNLNQIQSFEGQTGLLIQQNYDSSLKAFYSYKIDDENIDLSEMIKEIIFDTNTKLICTKFINTLINIIFEISNKYKNLPIVLSGGVFQNKVLLEEVLSKFEEQGREVYYPKEIPINDAGISVGQAYFSL